MSPTCRAKCEVAAIVCLLASCAIGPAGGGSDTDRQEVRPRPSGQTAGPCGAIDYVGTCVAGDSGETLLFCDAGVLHEVHCAQLGGTCGLVDGLYDCVRPDGCDLPAEGICSGSELSYCAAGGPTTVSCNEGPCAFDPDYGVYRCLQGCSGLDPDLTSAGACVVGQLQWCDGGVVHVVDCELAGLVCSVQDGQADCVKAGDIGCSAGAVECPGDPSTCIQDTWFCDGIVDCAGSTDEQGCGSGAGCDGFTCGSGECVPNDYVCDCEYVDCGDGSDESYCDCPTS